MANSASARKRARQNVVRRVHNMGFRSRMRTYVKRVMHAVEAGDKEVANAALKEAGSILDKTVSKGLIHANKAARTKSRLNAHVKGMS